MGVANGSSTSNGHASSRAAKHNLPPHFIGGNHLEVAVPSNVKDFVEKHEGHSVISSVSRAAFWSMSNVRVWRDSLANGGFNRSLLPTTVSQPSRRFGRYENGPTKPSATNVRFSSRSWQHRTIYRQMRTISVWLINTSKCRGEPIIIIMRTSS